MDEVKKHGNWDAVCNEDKKFDVQRRKRKASGEREFMDQVRTEKTTIECAKQVEISSTKLGTFASVLKEQY